MSLAIYLASDIALATLEWDKNNPSFFVLSVHDSSKWFRSVKHQFTKRYIYCMGSHDGCGSGFYYANNDMEEHRKRRESCHNLVAFIKDALSKTDALELFCCWAGDEIMTPEKRITITPDDIMQDEFMIQENNFYLIITDK